MEDLKKLDKYLEQEWSEIYNDRLHDTLIAICSCCGRAGVYEMSTPETARYAEYLNRGRAMGYLDVIFPRVPAWIRSGAIDQYSGGFCICPECCSGKNGGQKNE